jgi:hypothetical protein
MTGTEQGRRAAALLYARILAWGTRLGLTMLVLSFAAYATGLVAPHVPIEEMAKLWSSPAPAYLQASGLQPGWDWARFIHRADMLSLAAIAFLASCSIVCLAAAARIFFRIGERPVAVICVLEIVVLALAASGLLVAH